LCFGINPRRLKIKEEQVAHEAVCEQPFAICTLVVEVVQEDHPLRGTTVSVVQTHVAGKEPACVESLMEAQLAPVVSKLSGDLRLLVGDLNGCTPGARKAAIDAGLLSAYDASEDAMANGGPIVTAHNDEYHWCGELDFIWYMGESRWRVSGLAQIPEEERLCATRTFAHPSTSLPCDHWPSDHISLIADFQPA
jgi:hypothetical protein